MQKGIIESGICLPLEPEGRLNSPMEVLLQSSRTTPWKI